MGAMVQLVVADNPAILIRSAVSDSSGRFSLDNVPAGRYKLGFFHPILDSLGVEAPLREVYVEHRPMRADLALPAPARLRAALCGPQSGPDSTGVVVGVVRNAAGGTPAGGVSVAAQWLEFSFTREGRVRRAQRLEATTGGQRLVCDMQYAARGNNRTHCQPRRR